MKHFAGFAVGIALTTTLFAADPQWVEVATAGDGAVTSADTASVKHVEGKTLVWFLTSGAAGETLPLYSSKYPSGTSYKSQVALQSFDCVKGRSATLQISYYSEENMTGEHLGSTTASDDKLFFSYPTPGTVGSAQLDYVCKYLSLKKKK
jgi:hypothetical protein